MKKTFQRIMRSVIAYLNKPKQKDLLQFKILTVGMSIILIGISIFSKEHQYERIVCVFVLGIITYVLILIKEKQKNRSSAK